MPDRHARARLKTRASWYDTPAHAGGANGEGRRSRRRMGGTGPVPTGEGTGRAGRLRPTLAGGATSAGFETCVWRYCQCPAFHIHDPLVSRTHWPGIQVACWLLGGVT